MFSRAMLKGTILGCEGDLLARKTAVSRFVISEEYGILVKCSETLQVQVGIHEA